MNNLTLVTYVLDNSSRFLLIDESDEILLRKKAREFVKNEGGDARTIKIIGEFNKTKISNTYEFVDNNYGSYTLEILSEDEYIIEGRLA